MMQPALIEKVFHLLIGAVSLALLALLTAYVTTQVSGAGTFPWWVYPAYGLYTLTILFADDILFHRGKK